MKAITYNKQFTLWKKVKFTFAFLLVVYIGLAIKNPVMVYEHSKAINKWAANRSLTQENRFIKTEFGQLALDWKLCFDQWKDTGSSIGKCGRDFVGFWVFLCRKK